MKINIFFAVSILFLTGCNKEKYPGDIPSLSGTWRLIEITDGDSKETITESDTLNDFVIIEFTDDSVAGNFFGDVSGKSISGYYIIENGYNFYINSTIYETYENNKLGFFFYERRDKINRYYANKVQLTLYSKQGDIFKFLPSILKIPEYIFTDCLENDSWKENIDSGLVYNLHQYFSNNISFNSYYNIELIENNQETGSNSECNNVKTALIKTVFKDTLILDNDTVLNLKRIR